MKDFCMRPWRTTDRVDNNMLDKYLDLSKNVLYILSLKSLESYFLKVIGYIYTSETQVVVIYIV